MTSYDNWKTSNPAWEAEERREAALERARVLFPCIDPEDEDGLLAALEEWSVQE